MSIEITGAEAQPAVTFNKIHLLQLSINQEAFSDDSLSPVYVVYIHYKMYGVANGTRYYKEGPVHKITVSDFIVLATEKAGGGDMSLLLALQGIESGVASIIKSQDNLDASVV